MYVVLFVLLLSSGLIHANHGLGITDYIAKELRNQSNEVRLLYVYHTVVVVYSRDHEGLHFATKSIEQKPASQ